MIQSAEFPSNSVRRASYDSEARTLTLEFRTGRSYRYKDVPSSVYDWLLRASSKGAFVTRLVKDRYEFEEVTVAQTIDLEAQLGASLDTLRKPAPKSE
jgi:hypothetical protein